MFFSDVEIRIIHLKQSFVFFESKLFLPSIVSDRLGHFNYCLFKALELDKAFGHGLLYLSDGNISTMHQKRMKYLFFKVFEDQLLENLIFFFLK